MMGIYTGTDCNKIQIQKIIQATSFSYHADLSTELFELKNKTQFQRFLYKKKKKSFNILHLIGFYSLEEHDIAMINWSTGF